MTTMPAAPERFHHVREALARQRWALWLLLATGCGSRSALHTPLTSPSVGTDGATSSGGAGGQGAGGNAGGATATGDAAGSGGVAASGGLTGSGGATATGGGAGGRDGVGGASSTGGVSSTGGSTQVNCSPACTANQDCIGGSCVPSPRYGMSCATDQDCPLDSTCCDGSDGGCDETRLPSGDGANPGELVLSADGSTVTDTITGLLWQREDRSLRCVDYMGNPSTGCTWQEAHDYCASLVLGGVSGWRVPTPAELLTVVELAQTPATTGFADRSSRWTSGGSSDFGIYLDSLGVLQYCSGSLPEYVLCVRGSRCYPKSRFVVLDGGLVRDTLTGLVWQQQGSTRGMTWADAQSYCSSLGTGFRLPTYRELLTLVGFSSDPTTAFPGGVPGPFWTSTPYGSSTDSAYYVDYYSNLRSSCENSPHSTCPLSCTYTVRCVR